MQLKQVQQALLSRLPGQVHWALNSLTLASFHTEPELLLEAHFGLLDALMDLLEYGLQGRADPHARPEQEALGLTSGRHLYTFRPSRLPGTDQARS